VLVRPVGGEAAAVCRSTAREPPRSIDFSNERYHRSPERQVRAIPRLITASYGAYRTKATLAAVRAGFVRTLVTDDDLARALLR
jgi:hypothetical protein